MSTDDPEAPRERGFFAVSKLSIEFLRVVIWPFIIVLLLVVYRGPARRAAEAVATRLASAQKVSVGSLSFEIREQALELGNPELAERLDDLSPGAIQTLLQIPLADEEGEHLVYLPDPGEGDFYELPPAAEMAALKELQDKGFVVFDVELDGFMRFFHGATREQVGKDTLYFPRPSISRADRKRIQDQGYRLTERGRKGVQAILKAIASELRRAAAQRDSAKR